MKAFFSLVALFLVGWAICGFFRAVTPDYESNVTSIGYYDNYVSRGEADSPGCISLNSRMITGGDGVAYNNGTYDTIDGKTVCGVRADIVTEDGHRYAAFFNRFDNNIKQDVDNVGSNEIECYDIERTKCSGGSWGINKTVHKLD